ncbi:sugar phosphate nucleotidyltransferase [Galbibacter sp. EGI 63066]|uniref:mannose-1-phosphate guanylyltransferase n=1 Tax=Galbibacter sp. EGI 63066 TaxID=2993559 RepID=UPI0022493E00|nr:sugar phosphate nucleotidyltransferase [Galbibacter sp. EGI 63066]MCX2680693.1 sugar phosphate nucleotidyltransferase [Galbibacter sp. EGI 63066]
MNKIVNAILSGGFGTRLWPLSRPEKPKQFLQLFGDRSLFQHTVLRNADLVDANMILTNESHYKMATEQMQELDKQFDYKVLEPVARNTAPAITLATLSVDKDDILFVTPSDHMISDKDVYDKCVKEAVELAAKGFLVTFSIKPTYPETGYGYIEYKGNEVLSFREKPDAKTAKEFVESGRFNWNSGMFCFKAGTFLNEIKKYSPEIYTKSVEAYQKGITKETMSAIPEDSVDYAVFEKSDRVKTVLSDFSWSDMGTFDSLMDYFLSNDKEDLVKTIKGTGVKNCHALSKKMVLGVGIKDLIVIETEDTILVLPKGEGQKVKNIFNEYGEA